MLKMIKNKFSNLIDVFANVVFNTPLSFPFFLLDKN